MVFYTNNLKALRAGRSEEYCLIVLKNFCCFRQSALADSIFDIQNAKQAKAVRLKGEAFKLGEWKNKSIKLNHRAPLCPGLIFPYNPEYPVNPVKKVFSKGLMYYIISNNA